VTQIILRIRIQEGWLLELLVLLELSGESYKKQEYRIPKFMMEEGLGGVLREIRLIFCILKGLGGYNI